MSEGAGDEGMCACVALYWEKCCMKGEMPCDGKRDVLSRKERCVVMEGEMCCVGKRDVL